jgi:multicomponent Na+:H+ antiporter subunit F
MGKEDFRMSISQYVLTGGVVILIILALLSVVKLFFFFFFADRLVALNTLNAFVVGIMILIAAITDSIVMVNVAIVYCALSFVGTLFFTRYMEGGV